MTDLNHTKNQTWEVQGAGLLDTREVFARLAANQINQQAPCRASEDPDWAPLKMRFSLIVSGDGKRKYGLLKRLGDGAFGTVHLAFALNSKEPGKTGRLVAIKSPTRALLDRFAKLAGKNANPKLSETQNAEQARSWAKLQIGQFFSEEAALTARVAMSENVVKIIDHDITVPYMALEYCNGGSLSDRMTQPYELPQVLQWGFEISSALAAAHSLKPDKLVHRDLKPDNILIHDNVLKISDFGTSQLAKDSESLSSLDGGYTPLYGAPEAFDGRAYPATDVWSLGVILYELICGERPFKSGASLVALAQEIMLKPHSPLNQRPGLLAPSELYDVIDSCLAKEPEDRPSAADLAQFFTGQISGQPSILTNRRLDEIDANDEGNQRKPLSPLLLIALLIPAIFAIFLFFDWIPARDPLAGRLPISFEISSHKDGQWVKKGETVFIGRTEPNSRIEVEGFIASTVSDKDGAFQIFLELDEGKDQLITLRVKVGKHSYPQFLRLNVDNLSPRIYVSGENDERVRLDSRNILRGRVSESHLKTLTINGDVVLVKDSHFQWPLPNNKACSVTLVARDLAGWRSSQTISVLPSFVASDMAVLNDREQWNETENEKQDWVIKRVGEKLGAGYHYHETETYECNGITQRIASFRHIKSQLILHLIPGGRYSMGSMQSPDERPVHAVTIKPFLIGRFELRQYSWDKIGGAKNTKVSGPNLPIDSVSFADCQAWLKKAGSGLRLPSESEWEYAAKAGSTTRYFWGDSINPDYFWFSGNENKLDSRSRAVTLHYQLKKWNAFGLVDMSGNLWEWCEDHWINDYYNGPSNSQPRRDDPKTRVARGGSWIASADTGRSANRGNFVVQARDSSLGLRVAKSLD